MRASHTDLPVFLCFAVGVVGLSMIASLAIVAIRAQSADLERQSALGGTSLDRASRESETSAPASTPPPDASATDGPETYPLFIDTKFSPQERAGIVAAARNWERRTKNLVRFRIGTSDSFVDCTSCVTVFRSTLVFVSSIHNDESVAMTRTSYRNNASRIYIAMDYIEVRKTIDPAVFSKITLHELGHAIGLDHDAAGTIMAERAALASDDITCKDLGKLLETKKTTVTLADLCPPPASARGASASR